MFRWAVFAVWVVLSWVAPAAAAGAMGWSSVWGSGSAFVALLIPIPVADGVLHVPSFVLVSAALLTQPWSWRIAGLARGILLGGALAGLVMLVDVTELYMATTSDAVLRQVPWQQNPLALCVLTDCVIAQFFLGAFGGRGPITTREWSASLAIVVALPVLCAAAWLQADSRMRQPLTLVGTQPGPERTDDSYIFHSRLPMDSDALRKAGEQAARERDPRRSLYSEDVALLFFDSLEAARWMRLDETKRTLCIYEDGTPMAWHRGRADCFTQHESFSDRVSKAFEARDRSLPVDVSAFLARRDACAGRKQLVAEAGAHDGNDEMRTCTSLEALRQETLAKHGGDARVAALLAAVK